MNGEDQVKGNKSAFNVSIVSVSNVCELQVKTNLASRSMSVNTSSSFSTERQRSGAAKSRSTWGKDLLDGKSNLMGAMGFDALDINEMS